MRARFLWWSLRQALREAPVLISVSPGHHPRQAVRKASALGAAIVSFPLTDISKPRNLGCQPFPAGKTRAVVFDAAPGCLGWESWDTSGNVKGPYTLALTSHAECGWRFQLEGTGSLLAQGVLGTWTRSLTLTDWESPSAKCFVVPIGM